MIEYYTQDAERPNYWLLVSSIVLLVAAVGSFVAISGDLLSDLAGLRSSTLFQTFWQSFNVLSFYLPALLFFASRALVRPQWLHAFGLLSFSILPLITLNGIVQVLLATPSNLNLWLNERISTAASLWGLSVIFAVQVLFLLHPAFRNFLLSLSRQALRSFQESERYPEEDLEQLTPRTPDISMQQPPTVPETSSAEFRPTFYGATNNPVNNNDTWDNMAASLEMEPPLDETLEPQNIDQSLPEFHSFSTKPKSSLEPHSDFYDETEIPVHDVLPIYDLNTLDPAKGQISEPPVAKPKEIEPKENDNPFEFPIDPIPEESGNEHSEAQESEVFDDIRDPGFDLLNTNADSEFHREELSSHINPRQLAFDHANLERPPFFAENMEAIERHQALDPKEPYSEYLAEQKDAIRQEKILLRIQETDGELVDEDMADKLLQREKTMGDWRDDYSKQIALPHSFDDDLTDDDEFYGGLNYELDDGQAKENKIPEEIQKAPEGSKIELSDFAEEPIENDLGNAISEEAQNACSIQGIALASKFISPTVHFPNHDEQAADRAAVSQITRTQTQLIEEPADSSFPPLSKSNVAWDEFSYLDAELSENPNEKYEPLATQPHPGMESTEIAKTLVSEEDWPHRKNMEIPAPVIGNQQEAIILHDFDTSDIIAEEPGFADEDWNVNQGLQTDVDIDFPFRTTQSAHIELDIETEHDEQPELGAAVHLENFTIAEEQALHEKEERNAQIEEERAQKMLAPPVQKSWQVYQVAMSELVSYDPREEERNAQIDQETEDAGQALLQTLRKFKIEAEMIHILKGPSITEFGVLPAPGIKLNRVEQLADNLAMELAARSIRIVAPIPGKKAVGIEIPNRRRSTVSFSALMDSKTMQQARWDMQLPIVLGKEINGEIQIADLRRMPHLLIAGATGSGKSVCVNVIISSLILSHTPQQLRLLLVDPKIVELKQYNDIPHLLTPVIIDAQRALKALQWVSSEMERRYALLDAIGAGNKGIESYNRYIKKKNMATMPLEFIVVIIDEFADLISLVGKELEGMISRLAAMSRAVGIHLVLATQRPSVDVVTGLIKANFPTRIAFMVASQTDSRTILDQKGAEQLLGQGDMLFSLPGQPLVRVQGAYLSEEEADRISSYIKTLGAPAYLDEIIFENEEATHSLESSSDDLFPQAVEIALQAGEISTSFLQRKLSIGYNRAARIIDEMEDKGIIGPAQGSKKREVLHSL